MVDKRKRNDRQYLWQKENCERISFIMPKGMKQEIKNASDHLKISSSEFIRAAIKEKIDRVDSL